MSNIGLRIIREFERPSAQLIQQFSNIPVANIADMMNRMFCMDARLRPLNDTPLLGPAFTVKVRAGDNLLLHKALDMARAGDCLVVDAQGDVTNSIMGELMVLWAKKRGIHGFIIDGAIRDCASLRASGLPIYAAGVTPAGPYKDGPGEINTVISCGGVVVHPGDLLVGDRDGVVVIPRKHAAEVLKKAEAKQAAEAQTMLEIERGTWDRLWVDRALRERGCELTDE